jgi:hypothetical protein
MELLLNLAWLLLALPAYWLWRVSKGAPSSRRFAPVQCLFALACTLVVLFPIVSATDDLHAMRAEVEESPLSKRSMRQANGDKPSSWNWHSQPSLVSVSSSAFASVEAWHQFPKLIFDLLEARSIQEAGRAPPPSSLLS